LIEIRFASELSYAFSHDAVKLDFRRDFTVALGKLKSLASGFPPKFI